MTSVCPRPSPSEMELGYICLISHQYDRSLSLGLRVIDAGWMCSEQ